MKYYFGQQLCEAAEEEDSQLAAVYVTASGQAQKTMEKAQMEYEGELNLRAVGFCKLEVQQECLAGSLYIPKLLDVLGSHYQVLFFINKSTVVIIDDDDFTRRLIGRIRRKKSNQGDTKERFLYNFLLEFISRDLELLSAYEKRIMRLEEAVLNDRVKNFQQEFVPIRRELLALRSYYDELMDMGRELEENENGFFDKKELKYFGTVTDRADRLMGKTLHLLEYAQQVRDAYQSQVETKQNKNMQFLTVISTIFFPLTLITGWYGMNFQNMPELEDGYPGVIVLSLAVIAVIIVFFRKKKIL